MAIDGAMLSLIRRELLEKLEGAKVDKVQQPTREELVLIMRGRGGNFRLLISARASCPRINITAQSIENPAQPPMFCMLMRKRLCSARLSGIRQLQTDRVLMLDFDAINELGDRETLTMIVEIMGRCSNIVLTDAEGKIIDAIKRVDGAMSAARMILPGLRYELPPQQDKLDIYTSSTEDICSRITASRGQVLSKAILGALQGVSPIVARELAWKVCPAQDVAVDEMSILQQASLAINIDELRETLIKGGIPSLVSDGGRAIDLTFFRPAQYGEKAIVTEYESYSQLLDAYCGSRDNAERMRVKEQDLLKLLSNAADRTARKLAVQQKELEQAGEREQLRIYGDLINANIYRINKGDCFCEVEDYYNDNQTVRIKLDPMLTPAQNAQAYYKDYRRAQTAEAHLIPLIEQGERELEYIDAVFDSLSRASTSAEVAEIRAELTDSGYIKRRGPSAKKQPEAGKPVRFVSDDGFEILVGKNNRQNDRLTLKDASNSDMWLHAAKMPGAHVIIRAHGETVPDRTVEQAAVIAATNSRGVGQGLVPVDYTQVRNVTRQPGGRPGMVNYVNYHTVFVRSDEELCERLKSK